MDEILQTLGQLVTSFNSLRYSKSSTQLRAYTHFLLEIKLKVMSMQTHLDAARAAARAGPPPPLAPDQGREGCADSGTSAGAVWGE